MTFCLCASIMIFFSIPKFAKPRKMDETTRRQLIVPNSAGPNSFAINIGSKKLFRNPKNLDKISIGKTCLKSEKKVLINQVRVTANVFKERFEKNMNYFI